MTPIIEHKNGDARMVRDDVAAEYVACVTCRGMGNVPRCTGQLGSLWRNGWQINSFGYFWCDHCDGQGIWQSPQETAHD